MVEFGAVDCPARWMRAADAVILPTRYDAAANTTLEAMASGVPAITSAADGNAELVPDPKLVVSDPTNVDGFAHALHHAWQGRTALGLQCRAVAESWPVSRNGMDFEALYTRWTNGETTSR